MLPLHGRILVGPLDPVLGVIDESMKAVSQCLRARMLPLRILRRVIAHINLKSRCSYNTLILLVLRFTQFHTLDGNSGETRRRVDTFFSLQVVTS